MPGINAFSPSSSSSSSADLRTSSPIDNLSQPSSAERRVLGVGHQTEQSEESNAFLTLPLKTGKEAHRRHEREIPRIKRFADMRVLLESATSIEVPPEFQEKMEKLRGDVQGILDGLGESFRELEKSTNPRDSERAKKDFEAQYEELSNKLKEIREGLRACVKPNCTDSKQGQENIGEQHSLLLQLLLALFALLFFTKSIPSCFSLFDLLAPNSKSPKGFLPPADDSQKISDACQIEEAASIWRKVDKFGASISPEFDDLYNGKPTEFLRLEMDELRAQLAALQIERVNPAGQEVVSPPALSPPAVFVPVVVGTDATSVLFSSTEESVSTQQTEGQLPLSSAVVSAPVLAEAGATPVQLSSAKELASAQQTESQLLPSSAVVAIPVLTETDATPVQLSSAKELVSTQQTEGQSPLSSASIFAPVLRRADSMPARLSSAEALVSTQRTVRRLRPSSAVASVPVLTRTNSTSAQVNSAKELGSAQQTASRLLSASAAVPASTLRRADSAPTLFNSATELASAQQPESQLPLSSAVASARVLRRADSMPTRFSYAKESVDLPPASEPVPVPNSKTGKHGNTRRVASDPGVRGKSKQTRSPLSSKGKSNKSISTEGEIDNQVERLSIAGNVAQRLKPTPISFPAAEGYSSEASAEGYEGDGDEFKNRVSDISGLSEDHVKALQELKEYEDIKERKEREKQRNAWNNVGQAGSSSFEADSAYGSMPNGESVASMQKRHAAANSTRPLDALKEAGDREIVGNLISADNSSQEGPSLPRNFGDIQLLEATVSNLTRELHLVADKVQVLEDEKQTLEQKLEEQQQKQAQQERLQKTLALAQDHLSKKFDVSEVERKNQGQAVSLQGQEITRLGQETLRQGRFQVEQEDALTTLSSGQAQLFGRMQASETGQRNQSQILQAHGREITGAISNQARVNTEMGRRQVRLERDFAGTKQQLWTEHDKFKQEHEDKAQKLEARLRKKYEEVKEKISSVEDTVQFALKQQQEHYKEFNTRIEQLGTSTRSSLDSVETELKALDEIKLSKWAFEADKALFIKKIREELQYLTTEAANPLWEELRSVRNEHENFFEENWKPLVRQLDQIVPQLMTQIQEASRNNTLNEDEINKAIVTSIAVLQEKFDNDISQIRGELFSEAQSLIASHANEVAEKLRDLKSNLEIQHENIKLIDANTASALTNYRQNYQEAIAALGTKFSKDLQTAQETFMVELGKVEAQQGLKNTATQNQLKNVRTQMTLHEKRLKASQEQLTAQAQQLTKETIERERGVKSVKTSLQDQIDTIERNTVTHEDLERSQAYSGNTILNVFNSRLESWGRHSSAAIAELEERFMQANKVNVAYAKGSDEKWDVLMMGLSQIFESAQKECMATFMESTKELVVRMQDIESAQELAQEQVELLTQEQGHDPLLAQKIAELEKNITECQQNGKTVGQSLEALHVEVVSKWQTLRETSQKGDLDLEAKFVTWCQGIESTLANSQDKLEKKDKELQQLVQRVSKKLNDKLDRHDERLKNHDGLIAATKQDARELQMGFQSKMRERIEGVENDVDRLKTDQISKDELNNTAELLQNKISTVSREVMALTAGPEQRVEDYVSGSSSFKRALSPRSSRRVNGEGYA